MANTDSDESRNTFDEELAELAESINRLEPKLLPDNSDELGLLHRNVSDAIANLDDLASTYRAEHQAYSQFADTLKLQGCNPLIHLPELPLAEDSTSPAVRWDAIGQYLSGTQRLAIEILRKRLADAFRGIEERRILLLSPEVVDEVAEKLGLECPPELALEEFRQRIARNFATATMMDDQREMLPGLQIAIDVIKKLEIRIIEKQNEQEYLYAGWRSPAKWRMIFEEYEVPMSQKTWQRRIKDGKIRIHPNSTKKRVAIHQGDLPPAFVESLKQKNSP